MQETSREQAPFFGNRHRSVRFGEFDVDLHLGEIRRAGVRLKLQEQPFRILQVLLERPGELVTREELRAKIWPDDTFGDFDHAVNVAVGKLRNALGDSADEPSFIETVPRRGYRFVAPVDGSVLQPIPMPSPQIDPADRPQAAKIGPLPRRVILVVLALITAGALIGVGVWVGHRTARPRIPEFQRLTARRGTVYTARFAPDGRTVFYTAAWDGSLPEVFQSDLSFNGTRPVGLTDSGLLAVSSTGQLAIAQNAKGRFMLSLQGTLGEVPLTGGSPRSIAENIEWADWTPDGKSLAVVRHFRGRERLEFPVGQVIYDTAGSISHPRFSPHGDMIAFLDHPTDMDDKGQVSVVDLAGHKTDLSKGWESEEGLAWAPDGKEIWFSAAKAGLQRRIFAVDLKGHLSLRYSAPGGVTLEDIASDGRVLLTRDEPRAGIMGRAPGESEERNLSWLDWSLPTDLSPDGKFVLFDEEGEAGGPNYTVAIRDLKGTPPIPLGDGMSGTFSPDGRWVSATIDYNRIVLLPTGAGTPRHIDPAGILQYGHVVRWLPNGKELLFSGREAVRESRCFIQAIDGGKPRAITPEGEVDCRPSPDGEWIAAKDVADGTYRLFPVHGGLPRPIAGLLPMETFIWGSDPRYVYVTSGKVAPLKISRLDLETGKREPFREFNPSDMTGICELKNVFLSRNDDSYVYGFTRLLSDLYLVRGLN